MKRIISIFLLWAMSLNVLADSGAVQDLQRAYDNYSYAMTVEWDQVDQKDAEAKTKVFLDEVSKLTSEKGLGLEEVKFLLRSRIQNKELLSAINLKAEMMGASPDAQDVVNLLKESTDEFYRRGASWNGDVQTIALIGVGIAIFAVLIAKAVWWDKNHHCTKYDQAEECTDYYDCHGESCYYNGTSCGMITRCTKYERNE